MEVELPTGGTGAQTPGNLFGKQVLAGGIAGMLADAVMYPMMTVKSRLQVSYMSVTGLAHSQHRRSFGRCFSLH